MRLTLFMAVIGLAVSGLASGGPAAKKQTNIPGQSLGTALRELARDHKFQVLFKSELVRDLRTAGASGELTTDEALTRLLSGTALTFQYLDENTVTIVPASPAAAALPMADFHIAQSNALADRPVQTEIPENSAPDPTSKTIPELLVRGTRSLNTDIQRSRDDSQPYQVFGREEIQRSGAQNVEEFLRKNLTSMSLGVAQSQADGAGGEISSVGLRGLDSAQTLILVDGRRTASISYFGATAQTDLNSIPAASIERIEVLPSTAAGIYGGGATGGVINIVLRRDYSGTEIAATHEGTFDGGGAGNRVDLAGGLSFENGKSSVTFNGSFSERNDLLVGDRDLAQRARAHVLEFNSAAIYDNGTPPLGAATNIRSAPGFDPITFLPTPAQPLTLKSAYGGGAVGSLFTNVPLNYAGPASDNGVGLIANAGTYNLDFADTAQSGGGARKSLFNAPTITSVNAAFRREFSSRVQAFVELGGARNAGSFIVNNISGVFSLPATAAGNPFNQPITVTTPAFGADRPVEVTAQNKRGAAGVVVSLSHHWQGSADFTWINNTFTWKNPNASLLPTAMDAINSGIVDLFRGTNNARIDLNPYVGDPSVLGPADTWSSDAVARAAGPLWFSLPAGTIDISASVEHRQERFGKFSFTQIFPGFGEYAQTTYKRKATVNSAYIESRIPIVDRVNSVPGVNLLELRVSGRWDRYAIDSSNSTNNISPQPYVRSRSEFDSIDPLLSIRYQPTQDVTFRASAGTGFQPASLSDLQPPIELVYAPATLAFFGLTDPLRGNELLGSAGNSLTIASTGSPSLEPEQSDSVSAGIILSPRALPMLRLSVDWTKIKKSNNITNLSFVQSSIDLEPLVPGLIQRAAPLNDGFPVGPIVGFNAAPFNALKQEVEAYDAAVEYRFGNTRLGEFVIAAAATRNLHNILTVNLAAGAVDRAGVTSLPKTIGNGSLYWTYRNWSAGWAAHHVSGYWLNESHTVVANQGSDRIGSQLTHDVQLGYATSAASTSWLDDIEIRLGVKNVFNRRPEIDVSNPLAPYSQSGDPRMATYWLSLKKGFGQ